mmetsp:Transcript_19534/g.28967  ORF Transcript_19534/g.28967 Transcript_19534/m.28967 type:complete len:721 (+) Transcript_19534:249-2411(+)
MRNILPVLLALGQQQEAPPSTTTKLTTSYTDVISQFQKVYDDMKPDPATVQSFSVPSIQFSMVQPSSSSITTTTIDDNSNKNKTNKPMALYLPGLDGRGISGASQFDDLSETFDLWRMTVDVQDTSTFSELANQVVEFIRLQQQQQENVEITLLGESFGGLLAPMVALKLKNNHGIQLKGMVLINPATSFDDTNWDQLGPLLSYLRVFRRPSQQLQLPTPYSVLGGVMLSALIPDANQLQRLLQTILNVPLNEIPLDAMKQGFDILETQLPPETVYHRVSEWMLVGSQLVTEKRLKSLVEIPTLVIAGKEDAFLPSAKEARRLEKLMQAETIIVEGAGHFVLDPTRVNLTEALIYSRKIDPLHLYEKAKQQQATKKKYDMITDWRLPSPEEIKQTIADNVESNRQLTSPVFFSTSTEGKRFKGLGQLPSTSDGQNPIVFVANHQLFGLDLGLIIAQLLEERNMTARGLGHPILFNNNFTKDELVVLPNQPATPGLVTHHDDKQLRQRQGGQNRLFTKFGAVPVTPRNYYRLLQSGQNVLLFPGGVRETFHGPDEAHKLFWQPEADFVRTAVKLNATIVPLSSVGLADSFDILLSNRQLVELPIVGENLRNVSQRTIAARFDQQAGDELFLPPLFFPKVVEGPARQYFVFGKPFDTSHYSHKDTDKCRDLYQAVQSELNRGFDDVLEARPKDPSHANRWGRVLQERLLQKPVPTFGVDELN